MESLLGFKISEWDDATFAVLFLLVLAGLLGRIDIARKHPDAEAVKMMGYAGFLATVPWIQAFFWAFKPTDIVDIRRLPAAEARGIDEESANRRRCRRCGSTRWLSRRHSTRASSGRSSGDLRHLGNAFGTRIAVFCPTWSM
jgi:hypothetical protein